MKELTFYLPVFLIVAANVFYNICAKSIPETVNPFLSLLVTYLVSALVTLILLFVTGLDENFTDALEKINWSSVILGISVVALEFGYITAYRVGWNVSICSVVANIALAVLLVPIGILFYKEVITMSQLIGIILCMAGLFFINQ
ncbi:EamA family transporter [Acetobacterium tundrae]|uniref:EamA family transporter n=1 Tax=Acetobacterium tundrae TaxID=132932 RepID=UPI001FA9CAF4|nr:EamA family transporter [Acetobacterium tundrae]